MMRSPHGFGSYLRLVPRWSLGAQYERTPIQRQPARAAGRQSSVTSTDGRDREQQPQPGRKQHEVEQVRAE